MIDDGGETTDAIVDRCFLDDTPLGGSLVE